jgi:chemotaxis protein histidine kinase CheA/CheY-like chemotaxis protein
VSGLATGLPDDPELAATFAAEVEDRLASLSAGLLDLAGVAKPSRQQVSALFRDMHTIKGTARMIGLAPVVSLAHAAEDLLGVAREGRVPLRPVYVELLLRCCDALSRSLPGTAAPLAEGSLQGLVEAFRLASTGAPIELPELAATVPAPRAAPAPEPVSSPEPAQAFTAGPAPVPGPVVRGEMLRVGADKVHELLAVVGETEIDARALEQRVRRLTELAGRVRSGREDELPQLLAAVDALREPAEDHAARLAEVRSAASRLAMVPVGSITRRFPRLVHDLAIRTGKKVQLVVEGEDVELDKQVLDAIAESLGHLVTNAVDHGCDRPDERANAGKPAVATVRVQVRGEAGAVTVEVSDDGPGIDEQQVRGAAARAGLPVPADAMDGEDLLTVLCTPALSTRAEVSESSGRGVGLDAVRDAVDGLGGTLGLDTTPGAGSTFRVTVPVTLGVARCLLIRVAGERYALPVSSVVETVSLRGLPRHDIAGVATVVRESGVLPVCDLAGALGLPPATEVTARSGVVVRRGQQNIAWQVEALEGEAELVLSDLGSFLTGLPGLSSPAGSPVSAATIDERGDVVCVLDIRNVSTGITARSAATPTVAPAPRVLVVEDSVGVRELERSVLTAAGYTVTTCIDGLEGAAKLTGPPFDLVLTDIEMPGLDGIELTRRIRATAGWASVPVVVMTSLGSDADRAAGLLAGASAYLLKSDFDQTDLVNTVRRLVGR